MARVIHTATGPNGEAFKRTSATRRYTHVVIALPCIANARREIEESVARNKREFARNVRDSIEGWEPARWMVGAKIIDAAEAAEFPGCDMAHAFRERGKQHAIAWLAARAPTAEQYAAEERELSLAQLKGREAAGEFKTFVALSWSSRLDLAQKEAASTRSRSRHWAVVSVVDVDPA